jgi:hypothetical protein
MVDGRFVVLTSRVVLQLETAGQFRLSAECPVCESARIIARLPAPVRASTNVTAGAVRH